MQLKSLIVAAVLVLSSIADAHHPHHPRNHHDTFVINQGNTAGFDSLSVTSAPGGPIAPFPPGIAPLSEPELATAFIAGSKVRNSAGALIGVASEQEEIDFATLVAKSNWAITIPGRGTLFATQKEDLTGLFAVIQDMIANGEVERTFNPPLHLVTTVTGSGRVVGGSDEFKNAEGTFVESDDLFYISLATGTLIVTDVLEATWHKDRD